MKWLDAWIFSAYTAREADLAVYRLIYSLCAILTLLPCALWVGTVPQAFFSPPPSLPALSLSLPQPSLLVALNVLLSISLVALLVGWHTTIASVGTAGLLWLLKSWEYSPGKINHDILWIGVPLVMCTSGWGNALSVDSRWQPPSPADTPRGSWHLSLLALLIGIAMFTAGWPKLWSGWMDPSTHATYGHLMINKFITGREPIGGNLALKIHSTWFWKGADWSAVLMELGFVFSILHRRSFLLFLALACVFHLGVWMLFAIIFPANVVAYGAFASYAGIPWVARRGGFFSTIHGFVRRTPIWIRTLAILVVGVACITIGTLAAPERQRVSAVVILVLGGVVGEGYLARCTYSVLSCRFPNSTSGQAMTVSGAGSDSR